MTRSGTLAINLGQSRINGLLLGITGGNPNELSAATNHVVGRGLATGDRVRATGANGNIGNVPVFFITDIVRAPAFAAVAPSAAVRATGKPAARGAGKEAAGKKAAAKKTARKKTAGKKAAAKKAAAKKPGPRKVGAPRTARPKAKTRSRR